MAQRINTDARIHFVDESYMAIASAKTNYFDTFSERDDAQFYQSDCLNQYDGPSVDLILCNPPFHLNHAVDDYAGQADLIIP